MSGTCIRGSTCAKVLIHGAGTTKEKTQRIRVTPAFGDAGQCGINLEEHHHMGNITRTSCGQAATAAYSKTSYRCGNGEEADNVSNTVTK